MKNQKLVGYIAVILETSLEEIESAKSFSNFDRFDSLAVIQIAAILDSEFNCAIEPEQFELLDSMDSIINLISSN